MVMLHRVLDTRAAGAAAAKQAAAIMRAAITTSGKATIVLATGASQQHLLTALASAPGIDWTKVTAFHLDEYIGLGAEHPASFRRNLEDHFVARLPAVMRFVGIQDAGDPAQEMKRLAALIQDHAITICCVGIGENGHLAFNDPPADFQTEQSFIKVALNLETRRKQFRDGWFGALEQVPAQAITMSIRQIMRSKTIIMPATGAAKAPALRNALEGPVMPDCPASILQQHPDVRIFLDDAAANLLERPPA